MSALQEINANTLDKQLIAGLLWRWILENGEREFKLRVWIINKTFKVKDLHGVFALLLGPRPVNLYGYHA